MSSISEPPPLTARSSSPKTLVDPAAHGPWAAGAKAIRRFARPFISIQIAAAALVVAYQSISEVRAVCATLGAIRMRGGLAFSALSGAVAGGLLPEFLKWILIPRARRLPEGAKTIAFNTVFFAFNGMVIDLFYRQMARLFGSQATLATVVAKVAFDQFIFTPLWLAVVVGIFAWHRFGFRVRATVQGVRGHFYRTRVVPLLLPNWAFWIPMTLVIYSLPGPLQFLLFALALAAWSLIMVFIAQG